jgi:hypothetical protein
MSNTDIVREVDEELRREQVEKLWNQYRTYILAAAAAIVLIVAGYKTWQWQLEQQAASAGARFESALSLLRDGKKDDAAKALEAIVQSGAGAYPALAGLRLAALDADAGKGDAALARYEAIAISPAADVNIRGFAKLQAAQLRLDKADFTEMQNRLNDLATPDGVWRQSARQLLGLSAYKAGKLTEAQDQFALILNDKDGRGVNGQMAEVMQQLILAATVKAPGAEGAAPAPATPPATKTN